MVGTTALTIEACPETAGFATEVAVITIVPGPVAVTLIVFPVPVKVAGPVTVQVTACGTTPAPETVAVAVKACPGAIEDTEGETTTLVTLASGASVTIKVSNFVGSATDRASMTVVPDVGVAPIVSVAGVLIPFKVPTVRVPPPESTV